MSFLNVNAESNDNPNSDDGVYSSQVTDDNEINTDDEDNQGSYRPGISIPIFWHKIFLRKECQSKHKEDYFKMVLVQWWKIL